jgi:hypothetical protein
MYYGRDDHNMSIEAISKSLLTSPLLVLDGDIPTQSNGRPLPQAAIRAIARRQVTASVPSVRNKSMTAMNDNESGQPPQKVTSMISSLITENYDSMPVYRHFPGVAGNTYHSLL